MQKLVCAGVCRVANLLAAKRNGTIRLASNSGFRRLWHSRVNNGSDFRCPGGRHRIAAAVILCGSALASVVLCSRTGWTGSVRCHAAQRVHTSTDVEDVEHGDTNLSDDCECAFCSSPLQRTCSRIDALCNSTELVEGQPIHGVRAFYHKSLPTFRVGYTVIDAPPAEVAKFAMDWNNRQSWDVYNTAKCNIVNESSVDAADMLLLGPWIGNPVTQLPHAAATNGGTSMTHYHIPNKPSVESAAVANVVEQPRQGTRPLYQGIMVQLTTLPKPAISPRWFLFGARLERVRLASSSLLQSPSEPPSALDGVSDSAASGCSDNGATHGAAPHIIRIVDSSKEASRAKETDVATSTSGGGGDGAIRNDLSLPIYIHGRGCSRGNIAVSNSIAKGKQVHSPGGLNSSFRVLTATLPFHSPPKLPHGTVAGTVTAVLSLQGLHGDTKTAATYAIDCDPKGWVPHWGLDIAAWDIMKGVASLRNHFSARNQ